MRDRRVAFAKAEAARRLARTLVQGDVAAPDAGDRAIEISSPGEQWPRYLHTTSFSLAAALSLALVLGAIAALVGAQLLFTYAPFMQGIFGTRPLSLGDRALLVAMGSALMLLPEVAKAVPARTG